MRKSTTSSVALDPQWVEDFCKQYHIRRLALFGSALGEHFRPTSDVDIVVDFEPDARVGFISLAAMEEELSQKIGRDVDLRTPPELSRHFRQKILDGAEVLYVR